MKGGRDGRGLMRGVERERVVSGGEGIFGGGVGGKERGVGWEAEQQLRLPYSPKLQYAGVTPS